jgi:hypothetical protein
MAIRRRKTTSRLLPKAIYSELSDEGKRKYKATLNRKRKVQKKTTEQRKLANSIANTIVRKLKTAPKRRRVSSSTYRKRRTSRR